ncbi:MAG: DUF1697 domain-containing protein [Flavobacteriaceae bacterium]|jgi:uncharacterized protein (DUF1697 family)|nr:DUF1697 domain-containing protein [Flavobacteriaceae bacterium]
MKYIALLRGINVGGKNLIKMTDLKACFTTLGFKDAVTYIQSGNVLFDSEILDVSLLTTLIEKRLSEEFQYESKIVLVAHEQYNHIVTHIPKNFGMYGKIYRYNVLFLRPSLIAKDVVKGISKKEGVDEVYAGEGVIYFSNLIERASQSHLSRIIKQPFYTEVTIRNWNTTLQLFKLLNQD